MGVGTRQYDAGSATANQCQVASPNVGRALIVIGNRGTIEINPREAMAKDASVHGMLLFNATDDELRRIHAALYAGFDNGSLHPVVGTEFKLEDAPKAHEAVMQAGAFGKIVLIP